MIETTLANLFTKTGLTDDPDWSDPSTDEPDTGRQHELSWALAGPVLREQQVHKLQFFFTFRNGNDAEVAGTADIEVLMRIPAAASAATSTARASWKKIAVKSAHPHDEGLVVDVGGDGAFAVRLASVSAVGATKVFVSAQQWGGT